MRIAGAVFALSWLLCAGCKPSAAPAPVVDPVRAAAAITQGIGPAKLCRNDHDCGPGAGGSCVLGTCFGLLTTDNPAARHTLAERLRQADPKIQAAAEATLLTALGRPGAPQGARLGSIDGLGAILQARGVAHDCAAACLALRAEAASPDARIAVAARLALAQVGDASVRATVLDDLRLGTELLRAQAAYALASGARGREDADVQAALVASLRDPSPVVQEAALRALTPWAQRPPVREALLALKAGAGAHLGYAIDEALSAAGGAR